MVIQTLLMIASGGTAVGGMILLLISKYGETKDHLAFGFALMAIILSNIFNLVRIHVKRKEEKS